MGNLFGFRNDHDAKMNCLGSVKKIKDFIESNWDVSFEEIQTNNVTSFYEISLVQDMFEEGELFTDLR